MGNCLQSGHHASHAPAGIGRRVMSIQSRSQLEDMNDITLDKQASEDADKSSTSPSVSQVAPLPVVIQKIRSDISDMNAKNTILQHIQGPSVSYNTPTITNTVPSTQSGTYLDTPSNLFGTTPSSHIPSSISHASIPPLTLSSNSPDSLQTIPSYSTLNSNSETMEPRITPHQTPQQSPDIEDEVEHLDINPPKNERQRASSHDSMGITASVNKPKLMKHRRIFSLKRLKKKKNAFKFSKTPTIKPVRDPSNSPPKNKRKRGQTFDTPPQEFMESSSPHNDEQTGRHLKKRAHTLGLLHYASKHKKARGKAVAKANMSDHPRIRRKLRYKANTSIQPLESYLMEGNVKGVMRILSKYETHYHYPPFFMEYSNEQGHTLLMKAAFLGHFGLMKYLIQRYSKYRYAVLDSIEPCYGRDIASLCLEFMGDYINYESSGGKSALIFACSCKHRCRLNIVKYLLESGASVAEPRHSKHGKSPLIHAVEWKQENLMELLLDYGADVNVQDSNNGFTPLMYAAKFNNRDLCDFLLAHNADKTLVNHNGKTAVDLALTDQCWASLLALDVTKIPANALAIAASSPSKNRWGRYSLSYSYV